MVHKISFCQDVILPGKYADKGVISISRSTLHCGVSTQLRSFLFSFGSSGYPLGGTVAAVSAQQPAEHFKNALQNIATEWTPQSVWNELLCDVTWWSGSAPTPSRPSSPWRWCSWWRRRRPPSPRPSGPTAAAGSRARTPRAESSPGLITGKRAKQKDSRQTANFLLLTMGISSVVQCIPVILRSRVLSKEFREKRCSDCTCTGIPWWSETRFCWLQFGYSTVWLKLLGQLQSGQKWHSSWAIWLNFKNEVNIT